MEWRYDMLGWISSAALHIILALLFLISFTELKPFELDYATIAFAPSVASEAAGSRITQQFVGEKPLVELPRRRFIDDTSPLLRLPDSERQPIEAPSPSDKPDLTTGEKPLSDKRVDLKTSTPDIRERPGFRDIPLSDEQLTGTSPDALTETIAGDEMFSISWEGPPRAKVSGRLPTFPKDVKKAVTVKIAFDVTPDGTVSFASPLTKGVPELEKVSLDALKTWRFNPLDKSYEQVKQRGVVTFVFKLR